MPFVVRVACVVLAVMAAFLPGAAAAEFPMRLQPYVDVSVQSPPVPFEQDGVRRLAYELDVRSAEWHDVVIRRVEVLGSPDGRVLVVFEGDALRRALDRPGFPPDTEAAAYFRKLAQTRPDIAPPAFPDPPPQVERIGPGLSAVLFVWLDLPAGPAPRALRHRFTFETLHALVKGEAVLTTPETPVLTPARDSFGPPLRGGAWRVTNGPAPDSPHRRVMGFENARRAHAQRFALDLVKANEAGRFLPPGVEGPKAFFGYGEPVLAIGNAVVVEAVDGMPDNSGQDPFATAVTITTENLTGNRVGLRLDGGLFVLYAHLAPGSVRVKTGDCVKIGDVLGGVGNSGSAMGTHLHLQVSTGRGMSGEGVPFTLRDTRTGSAASPADSLRGMPTTGTVLWFP